MTLTDPCPMCDGRGERPCSLCDGSMHCPACRGKGKLPLAARGAPVSEAALEPCSWCNETGKCPQCEHGLVYCEYCNGTGEILVEVEAGTRERAYQEVAHD